MKDKIIKLWMLLEARRIEQGISFDHWNEVWGWRCSISYGIPVILSEGYGLTPEEALDALMKSVARNLQT